MAEKKRNNSSLARDSPIQTRRPEMKKETLDYEIMANNLPRGTDTNAKSYKLVHR
ncbi:hypothetical protein HOLleu_43304 [Holothuria leucospilota]|uniref:Uncharacterized protein n=1 Tax=Holothuria leucospilota TaxID=206669 RepID=A0A9Q0YDZ2_HOLLE|nr:hypothetical protein HOLleu_43304 [Holothuria leucospilota]